MLWESWIIAITRIRAAAALKATGTWGTHIQFSSTKAAIVLPKTPPSMGDCRESARQRAMPPAAKKRMIVSCDTEK